MSISNELSTLHKYFKPSQQSQASTYKRMKNPTETIDHQNKMPTERIYQFSTLSSNPSYTVNWQRVKTR